MALPMMPKATAVWLVENTTLTFRQIAEFCGLHELEIQAIADEEVVIGMVGLDPIVNRQLTQAEIDRCAADPSARLKLAKSDLPVPEAKPRGARYTPVSKRQDKPDAIAWLLRNFPALSDAALGRLLGTTKPTINAVRDRTHWNSTNIRPRDPVELGLCTVIEMSNALKKAGVTYEVAGELPEETEIAKAVPAAGDGGMNDMAAALAAAAKKPARTPAAARPTPGAAAEALFARDPSAKSPEAPEGGEPAGDEEKPSAAES